MEPMFSATLLDLVEEFRDHLPNYTKDCGGCGRTVPRVQPWVEDESDLLCFTCRQLAHAAANPYRLEIVEGIA
jgi:hypothetical protein